MSERIFSDLTKNAPTDTGQAPVLGDGESINFDVNLSGFSGPYTVMVVPKGAAGTVQRRIAALIGDTELELVALGAAPLNAPTVNHIVDESYSRLRITLTAGSPAPNGRTLVQVNGTRDGH